MSFMKGDLLSKARKLMKGGIMARPRWLDAVIRYPIEQLLYAAAVAVVADVAFFFLTISVVVSGLLRGGFLFCFP